MIFTLDTLAALWLSGYTYLNEEDENYLKPVYEVFAQAWMKVKKKQLEK